MQRSPSHTTLLSPDILNSNNKHKKDRRRLRVLNACACLLHLALAVTGFVLAGLDLFGLTINVRDTRISDTPTNIAFRNQYWETYVVGPANIAWMIPVFNIITACFHLLYYNMDQHTYVVQWVLEGSTNPLRWFEYTITATIMIIAIALSSGVFFVKELICIGALIAVAMPAGLIIELSPSRSVKLLAFAYSSVACLAAWTAIFIVYFANVHDIPVFVHVLIWGLFFQFMGFAFVSAWQGFYHNPKVQTTKFEIMYLVLSFTSKASLAITLFVGTRK